MTLTTHFMRLVCCVIFVFVLLTTGCEPPVIEDQRREMPAWFHEFGRFDGVNLPHLEPQVRFERFVLDESFVQNLTRMEWNTFRLPIEWDDYVLENGDLNHAAIATAKRHLRTLVERLREVHASGSAGRRILLIIDFHQFKFGRVCGGVGIPRGKIDETGLDRNDSNCMFLAFERFWNNDRGARDGWIDWAKAMLDGVPDLMLAENSWLTMAIEPINEPQFGFSSPVFSENIAETIWNIKQFTDHQIQPQIENKLHPFYRQFLIAMESVPGILEWAPQGLFVLDPFVLDHLQFEWGLGPVTVGINADGRYSSFLNLWRFPGGGRAVNWIAAPHNYLGAQDSGFLSMMPAPLRAVLERYPNVLVDRMKLLGRIQLLQGRMAEAGMETILGEWGTQTGLRQPNGRSGGHRRWIADMKSAIGAHTRGALWWQYVQDGSAKQDSFYLLRNRDAHGNEIPWQRQVLKCDSPHDLARLVFGRCGD